MDHRQISAIVLVAVVVLAGCSGGIPFTGDGSSANGTATDSGATTQPTATATPTAATTDTEAGTGSNRMSYPPGYSASGITNSTRAFRQHFSVLFSHDSFTFTRKDVFNLTDYPRSNPSLKFATVSHSNMTDKRAYTIMVYETTDDFDRDEYYQHGNISYTVSNFNNTTGYVVSNTPFVARISAVTSRYPHLHTLLSNTLRYVEYGDAERVTRNGETLWRYESTELLVSGWFVPATAWKENAAGEPVLNGTVNEFNATVLVDKEGLIQLATFSITYVTEGTQVTRTGIVRISRIDATTVKKPDWVSEIKAREGKPQTDQQLTGTLTEATNETGTANRSVPTSSER